MAKRSNPAVKIAQKSAHNAMFDADGNPSDAKLMCHVTGIEFERPDMLRSAQDGPDGEPQYISSLALSTDKTGALVLPAQK